MKGKIGAAALAAAMLAGAGCSTSGRVAVVEWDSREPEQIESSAVETAGFYGDVGEAAAPREGRGVSAWLELFELLAKLRVRVRVVSVEWRGREG